LQVIRCNKSPKSEEGRRKKEEGRRKKEEDCFKFQITIKVGFWMSEVGR